MKTKHIITLLTLALFIYNATNAQDVVRDTVKADSVAAKVKATPAVDTTDIDDEDDDEEKVIGAKRQPQQKGEKKEANILGAPVYYDTYGNVKGSGQVSTVYRRPEHHYLNSLDRRYCRAFLEGEMLIGRHDLAIGGKFTYLRNRWGAYGSLMGGARHNYLTVGAALRLSGYESNLDWHLYGGASYATGAHGHLGYEVGVRMALPMRKSEFCWSSTSMGYANYGGYSFFTLSMSLDIMALTLLFL